MNLTTPIDRHVGPPPHWVIGFMYLLELLPRLHLKFYQIYSNFYPNLNSSLNLNSNSNFFEFIAKLNLGQVP
jgi:hypothetical protein